MGGLHMMLLPQKSIEGCQYKEAGEPCGQPLSGRGAWQYCPLHGKVGQKLAKRQRNKVDAALFRQYNPLGSALLR